MVGDNKWQEHGADDEGCIKEGESGKGNNDGNEGSRQQWGQG